MNKTLLQQRLQRTAISCTIALLALVAAWLLAGRYSAERALIALLATTPLWLGLWRLLAADRRAYAWMTLVVIPYIVVGVMEAIANPAARVWAGACVFAAFTLFVVLIGYLRATR